MLAIIPARGGSKSIPRKNILPVAGKPLIAWTILAACRSQAISRIVVTTEDPEIAEAARMWGAEVPFVRPMELAGDETPGVAPLLHALAWLEREQNYRPVHVACLQPTSPLRTPEDIDAAASLLWERSADAVVSVTPVQHHPYWTFHVDDQGCLQQLLTPDTPCARRQDLPPAYAVNGAISMIRRDVFLAGETIYPHNIHAYVMPPERSVDIDSPWDLRLATLLLEEQREERQAGSAASPSLQGDSPAEGATQ